MVERYPDGGEVVKRVSRGRHHCDPPGWWRRRKLDLDYGSIWQCRCGQQWEWSSAFGDSMWVKAKDE